MSSKKMPTTAQQFLSELEGDFAFQAAAAMRQEAHHDEVARRTQEQAELIAELANTGVSIGCISDLLSVPKINPRSYIVLLDHLKRDHRPWLLEWIGRSFGRKDAYFLFGDLVDLLRGGHFPETAKTGLAASISEIARPIDLETVIGLATDTALGTDRIFFISNLMRSRNSIARAVLQMLETDPDLGKEISFRLNRAKR